MSTKELPEGVTLRLVAWDKTGHICEVFEMRERLLFRSSARDMLAITEAVKRNIEVVSENNRLNFTAELVMGIPPKCRTEQACAKIDQAHVSIDRFWELLCESVAEVLAK